MLSYGEVGDGPGKGPGGPGLLRYSQPNDWWAKTKAFASAHRRALAIAGGVLLLIIILSASLGGHHGGRNGGGVHSLPAPPPPPPDVWCYPYTANQTNSARNVTTARVCQVPLFPGDHAIFSTCNNNDRRGDTYVRLMFPNWTQAQWDQAHEWKHDDDSCPAQGDLGALISAHVPCGSGPANEPKMYSVIWGCWGNGTCSAAPGVRIMHQGCTAASPMPPPAPSAPTITPSDCPPYAVSNGTCTSGGDSPCNCHLNLRPGYTYNISTTCSSVQGDTFLRLRDRSETEVSYNDDARGMCAGNNYASRITYRVPCAYGPYDPAPFTLVEGCYATRTCNATVHVEYATPNPQGTCTGVTTTSSDSTMRAPPTQPWRPGH